MIEDKKYVSFKVTPDYLSGCISVIVDYHNYNKCKTFVMPFEGNIKGIEYPTIDVLRNFGDDYIIDILDNPDKYIYDIEISSQASDSLYYNKELFNAAAKLVNQLHDLQKRPTMYDKDANITIPKAETMLLEQKVFHSVAPLLTDGKHISTVINDNKHYNSLYYVSYYPNDRIIKCTKVIISKYTGIKIMSISREFYQFYSDNVNAIFVGGSHYMILGGTNTIESGKIELSKGIDIKIDHVTIVNMILDAYNKMNSDK